MHAVHEELFAISQNPMFKLEQRKYLLSSKTFNVTTITNGNVNRGLGVPLRNTESVGDVVQNVGDRELHHDPRTESSVTNSTGISSSPAPSATIRYFVIVHM